MTITSVTLQWDPVPCLDRNTAGPLDYYVGISRESATQSEEVIILSDDNSTYTVDGLDPDTSYYVRVHTVPASSSFTVPGNDHGPTSQQVHVQTLPGY